MEERSQDDLEKLFQSNLDDFEVSPSEKVWKDIERRLDEKPKRRFFWLFFLAGIVLLGGGSYGVYQYGLSGKDAGVVSENYTSHTNQAQVSKKNDLIAIGNKLNEADDTDNNSGIKQPASGTQTGNGQGSNQDLAPLVSADTSALISANGGSGSDKDKTTKPGAKSRSGKDKVLSAKKKKAEPWKPVFTYQDLVYNSDQENEAKKVNKVPVSSGTIPVSVVSDKEVKISAGEQTAGQNMQNAQGNQSAISQGSNPISTNREIDSQENNSVNNAGQDTLVNKSLRSNGQTAGNESLPVKEQSLAVAADTAKAGKDSSVAVNSDPVPVKEDSTVKKKKDKKVSRFSVAAFYSPELNKPFLSDRNNAQPVGPYEWKNESSVQNTFSAGLVLGYDQTARIRWQAGVSYTELSQSTDAGSFKFNWHDNLSFGFSNNFGSLQLASSRFDKYDNSFGTPNDTIHVRYDTRENLAYMKVPVVFNYKLITGRFSVYTIASVTGIVNVKNQMEFHVLGTSSAKVITTEISGIRKMNLGLMGGLGAQLNLFHGFYIFAEPSLKTSLFAINRRTAVRYVPFALGLAGGLGYHF